MKKGTRRLFRFFSEGGWDCTTQFCGDYFINWVAVSNRFYVHPENWGRWTQFDEHIFQRGWFNHQPVNHEIRIPFQQSVHPGRLKWNLRIDLWKGKSSSKPSFSGSMLIFGGVFDMESIRNPGFFRMIRFVRFWHLGSRKNPPRRDWNGKVWQWDGLTSPQTALVVLGTIFRWETWWKFQQVFHRSIPNLY